MAAYRDAWVSHDLDGLLKLVTPDVVFHNYTAGERVEGGEDHRCPETAANSAVGADEPAVRRASKASRIFTS